MTKQKALVKFYTKPDCHLCEKAKKQILSANCADMYEFEEINIEDDPELKALYGNLIPVILINGIKVFEFRVDAAVFRKVVMAA